MLTFSVNQDINAVVRKSGIADARPTTDLGRVWWSEAWVKALEDRTEDTVNLDAYGYSCERNTRIATGKKETALLTVEEVDSGMRGVANTVASYVDTNVDSIIESSEIKTFISAFLQFQEDLLIEEGVNLWVLIQNARSLHTASVDRLRELIQRYDMAYTIEGVLSNRECFVALEAEFNVNLFN